MSTRFSYLADDIGLSSRSPPRGGFSDKTGAKGEARILGLSRQSKVAPGLSVCYEGLRMASYAITTFGCQMNVHDSERMHEVLRGAGYAEVDAGVADVIVLNTCSVREKAEQKLRSEVGRLAKQKRNQRDL